jgi:hypothetical protein
MSVRYSVRPRYNTRMCLCLLLFGCCNGLLCVRSSFVRSVRSCQYSLKITERNVNSIQCNTWLLFLCVASCCICITNIYIWHKSTPTIATLCLFYYSSPSLLTTCFGPSGHHQVSQNHWLHIPRRLPTQRIRCFSLLQ